MEGFNQLLSRREYHIPCGDGISRRVSFLSREDLADGLTRLRDYGLITPIDVHEYMDLFDAEFGGNLNITTMPNILDVSPPESTRGLSIKQKWLLDNTQDKGKRLAGMKVKLCNFKNKLDGLTGIIVKIHQDKTAWIYTILSDTDGTPHRAKINQLEPIDSLSVLDPGNINLMMDGVRETICKGVKSRIGIIPSKELTDPALLHKLFIKLKEHKHIKDAGVLPSGAIFIITETLFPTSENTGKTNLKKPLGRFYIEVSYSGSRNITILNLDFTAGNYYHPHVETGGSICWGENDKEISSMYKQFQIYELFDFMILFLTIFPQKEGDPFIGYSEWMSAKTKDKREVNLSSRIL